MSMHLIKLENAKNRDLLQHKKRGLGDSKYMREEVSAKTALAELQKVVKIDSLR